MLVWPFSAGGEEVRFAEVNPAACRLVGYSMQELLAKGPGDLVADGDQLELCRQMELLQAAGEAVFELELIGKKQGPIPVEVQARLVQVQDVPTVLASIRDITRDRQVAAELRRNVDRYRTLIENANDLVQILDENGKILYVNAAWQKALGYTVEDLRHLAFFDLIHPDCLMQCRQLFQELLASQPVGRIEFALLAKGGETVVVEGSCCTKCVPGERPSVQGIFRDVSAKRRAEATLAQLRQRNELLLNAIGEGVLGIDLEGRHIFANPAASRMLGYEETELLGKVNHATWHHSRENGTAYPEEECLINRTWRKGESFHSDTEVFWRKNGTSFPVEYVSTPIEEQGRVVGAVITFSDISARRKTEEEKEKLQSQLLQARKMQAIGTLAGGVAHDFNNILTAILGNLELAMLKTERTASSWKNLTNIQHAAERAVDLIGQLLLFSRKKQMDFSALDLNQIIRELGKMLRRIIGEDIGIRLELKAGLWPVRGSITNMEQVLLNLAVNARDAMPSGGELTISTENLLLHPRDCLTVPHARPGRFICLAVADTGSGMGPEVLQHIFEPFYSTKESGKGSGLGLAVVYGIVQEHDGWIGVTSEPGAGSRFMIYLPAVEEMPGKKIPRQQRSLASFQGSGERILLVEDQEEVLQIASIALATNGYAVSAARNAEEAKEIFRREKGRFQLIFSDVVLPDQSGVDLVQELRQLQPGIGILLSSGYTDHKSQLSLIHQQGFPFLDKPYAVLDMLQAIWKILQRPSG